MITHITQSPQWAQFRSTTPNVKKVLEIDGLYIYIHKIPYLPFTVAYLPRPDHLNNLEEMKKACQKDNAIFLKIEPSTTLPSLQYPVSSSVLPRHTIYIDLTKSEDELLKEMHEKTRYNIKLAIKKGVVVKESQDIEIFIKLLTETEKRQGFYSHYPDYYRKLFDILKPKILVAYVKDTPVAAIMLFVYQDVLYYPYGGSDPKYKEYMAPNLLHFEAMKLGKKMGCKTYDLWGSYKDVKNETDPFWGIYRFKTGFGGTEIDFPPSIDIPLSPLYYPMILTNKIRWIFLKIFRG